MGITTCSYVVQLCEVLMEVVKTRPWMWELLGMELAY